MTDSYTETFQLLRPYVYEPTLEKIFADLGGFTRRFPNLEQLQTMSCHVRQYLSNDLEERWIWALHVALTCAVPASVVHERFREMASADFAVTFADREEMTLSTRYAREALSIGAFEGSNGTQLFVNSRRSGYSRSEIAPYLYLPLSDLTAGYPLDTRLVAMEVRRSSSGKAMGGVCEQRWACENVDVAIQRVLGALSRSEWQLIGDAEAAQSSSPVRLQHTPSGKVFILDKVEGYGRQELRGKLDHSRS